VAVKLTNDEIDQIVEYYKNGMSTQKIGEIFGVHYQTISKKLKERGVFAPKTHNWTEDDTEKLLEVYPTGNWDLILSIFPNRTRESLYCQASKLGIRSDGYFWTEHDKNILIDFYNNIDVECIKKMLDNEYTIKQIQNQAKKMGLAKRKQWSDAEISILRDKYESCGTYGVVDLLPGRSKRAIIGKAMSLGLRCDCFWSEEEVRFLVDNWQEMSDEKIAKELGRGVKGVSDKRRSLGLYYTIDHNGYHTLINYIRMNIVDWKKRSMQECGYKCVLTGGQFDDIHHKYGFNLILKEALEITGIDDRESIDDYSELELEYILNTFRTIQDKYPLGVCLSRNVHVLFHQIYGYGNNTIEQWDGFEEKYKNGELKHQ
jgi:hypothetical protein